MSKNYLRIAAIPLVSSFLWLTPISGAAVKQESVLQQQGTNAQPLEADLKDAVANFMGIPAQNIVLPRPPAILGSRSITSPEIERVVVRPQLESLARLACNKGKFFETVNPFPINWANPEQPIGDNYTYKLENMRAYIESGVGVVYISNASCLKDGPSDTAYIVIQDFHNPGADYYLTIPDGGTPTRIAHEERFNNGTKIRKDETHNPEVIARFDSVVQKWQTIVAENDGKSNSGSIASN